SSYTSFFSNTPSTTHIYTLSLHDALPISLKFPSKKFLSMLRNTAICRALQRSWLFMKRSKPAKLKKGTRSSLSLLAAGSPGPLRSEEHTSELQSRFDLVCRLLLEKKKKTE